jgi:hypothetical protein
VACFPDDIQIFDGAEWVSGTVTVGDATFDIQEDTWLYWWVTNWR